MTQEEILDYNKRCAEFLGYSNPVTDKDFYFVEKEEHNKNSIIPKLLELNFEKRFHSDWNWIVEVVDAIEGKGFDVCINSCVCRVADVGENRFEDIETFVHNNKKEAVVEAINKFLNYYNEIKK